MEPEDLFLCSQEPATGLCPELDELVHTYSDTISL
jgi:hypothetical protein